MQHTNLAWLCLLIATPLLAASPDEDLFDLDNLRVQLTPDLSHFSVQHAGRPVIIMRHQNPGHRIESPFDRTARPCPPFCIQPMRLHADVETIGELELFEYLQQISQGDASILVIDSRTPDYVGLGTIPGSMNIPYTRLDPAHADPQAIADLLQFEFSAVYSDGLWNFSGAKTLVFFCNGPWCGQSPTNIRALMNLGYPADKIKWYRGGLQSWEAFGLTTVQQEED